MQTELSRVSADAARQIIDATKVYREFLRSRNALRKLDGSMFWKKVDEYEYLAHRVGRKCTYLGTRSPETEATYTDFTEGKQRLQMLADDMLLSKIDDAIASTL